MPDHKAVILCVDDDPDILSYLQVVLEAEGYTFIGAKSGEEGLRVYKETRPDVVVLDLMMEEIDAGTAFVKELRLLGNQAPIFLLSSVGDNLSATLDYTALGLAGVFQKPLDRDRLLTMLETTLSEAST